MSVSTLSIDHAKVTERFNDMVWYEFGHVATEEGYSKAETLGAFALGNLDDAYATLDVSGRSFDSYRFQVGRLAPSDRARGGLEGTEWVTDEKIMGKSFKMIFKHFLARTGNIGGKGGICISRQDLEDMDPFEQYLLLSQHAEAHGINPITNVTATDINTFPKHMNMIAERLLRRWGNRAGAAASGVTEIYGGIPDLQAPLTGRGATRILERYFEDRATWGDEKAARIQEAMDGGDPLGVVMQGLGKAGLHYLRTLPEYVQPVGVMERNGGIVVPGGFLDREEVIRLAKDNGLDKSSARGIQGARWLRPNQREELWATEGVHVIAPAYDRNQFTKKDAKNASNSVIIVHRVANGGQEEEEAQPVLAAREIDDMQDPVVSSGGTVGSQGQWDKIMHPEGWTPEKFTKNWNQSIDGLADRTINARNEKRKEQDGEFVPFSKVVKPLVLKEAVTRYRNLQGQAA